MTTRYINCDLLPSLSDAELRQIVRWAIRHASRATTENMFYSWFAGLLRDEAGRRELPEGQGEPGLIAIPEAHFRFLSDAMVACYGLARSPLSDAQAKFADAIDRQVVTMAAGLFLTLHDTHYLELI